MDNSTIQSARQLFWNAVGISILTVFLIGCSSTSEPIQTVSSPIERQQLQIPAADPVDLHSVQWVVITRDNVDEILNRLERAGEKPVVIGITPTGYQRLSINFAEIRQHINSQRNILLRYKQYYESEFPSTQ